MESFNGTPIVAGVSSRGYDTWRRYNRAEDVVGLFVAGSRVWSHDENSAMESPAIFLLDRAEDGKLTLRVHGSGIGGTGDECYRFDNRFVDDMLDRPVRTEENSILGGEKHALFMFCMGGGGHRKWTTSMETMHDMVRTFKPLLASPVMVKEVDLDRLREAASRAGSASSTIDDELTINRAASDIILLRALIQSKEKMWDRTLAVEHGDESQAEPGWKWNRHARCWESRQLSGSYLTPIVISRVQAGWKRSDHNPSATTYTSALSAMLADIKEESG